MHFSSAQVGRLGLVVIVLVFISASAVAEDGRSVSFEREKDRLQISIGGERFATYVFRDEKILRPYFSNVHAPCGIRVTRRHPPREGQDSMDHATMHPGIWLAFGDVSGADFWRNKGTAEHLEFVEKPSSEKGKGTFVVRNRYVSNGKTICTEVCRHSIIVVPSGYLLVYDSRFSNPEGSFTFGDQEEMGLGVRVASQLRVKGGNGRILNSDGQRNEKNVWGKPAAWCDYSGTINGKHVGLTLMPGPENFRKSWYHARDYGALVANPFGRKALTGGAKSAVVVQAGETLRLRFGVLVRGGDGVDLDAAYQELLKLSKE